MRAPFRRRRPPTIDDDSSGRSGGGSDTATDVVRITSARASGRQELAARQRRYIVSMTIRTGCFIGAVFVDNWTRWLLIAGAVFLPYIAVVMANAADPGEDDFVPEAPGSRDRALPAGRESPVTESSS
ncbi:MAG: DUF3099 domain-containing protein [Nocardioides sp.]